MVYKSALDKKNIFNFFFQNNITGCYRLGVRSEITDVNATKYYVAQKENILGCQTHCKMNQWCGSFQWNHSKKLCFLIGIVSFYNFCYFCSGHLFYSDCLGQSVTDPKLILITSCLWGIWGQNLSNWNASNYRLAM
jgi:hypothetical protein